jgi:hypothetical protein
VPPGVSVAAARATARRWVAGHAAGMPGYRGAFHTGSICWAPADAVVPRTSDVDLSIVLEAPEPPPKLGKFRHDGVTLDVAFRPPAHVATAERVLGDPHLAGAFAHAPVIDDPSGALAGIAARVAADHAQRRWVLRRCDALEQRIRDRFARIDGAAPLADQIVRWVFPTGVLAHLPLAAALRNPTVRRRYVAARAVLVEAGRADVYATLLELLGCEAMPASTVRGHLGALADVVDATAPHADASALPFASDVGAAARPIVLDGSADLIADGLHREAVFWIVASYAKCLLVLADRGDRRRAEQAMPGFRRLVADLDVPTPELVDRRRRAALAYLPELRAVTDAMVDADPRITR